MGEGLDSWRPEMRWRRVDTTKDAVVQHSSSNGGPSSYYDFPPNRWVTLNDLMEYKSTEHWLGFALHLKDVVKASFRFGVKEGVDNSYDARKIVYSGLRLLLMIKGRNEVANFLYDLSRDPQFKPEHKNDSSTTTR